MAGAEVDIDSIRNQPPATGFARCHQTALDRMLLDSGPYERIRGESAEFEVML
jgi:hypothetical protein